MFIIIFVTLLISRLNSTLFSFDNLNLDEPQMIANAINLSYKNLSILEEKTYGISKILFGILN